MKNLCRAVWIFSYCIISTPSFSLGDSSKDLMRKTIEKAQMLLDESICKEITDAQNYTFCVMRVAYRSKRQKVCEALLTVLKVTDDIYAECYGVIAERAKDIKVCDVVNDPKFKERCIRSSKNYAGVDSWNMDVWNAPEGQKWFAETNDAVIESKEREKSNKKKGK